MCLTAAACALILFSSLIVPSSTETAIANGDTRTLVLFHNNTKESIEATFRVNGQYDPAVLDKLNWFLRDWRINEATHMDPRLFDVVWEVYRSAGATQPIVVYSAYRSPQTNAMLRRRSRAVAEHSQHMLGKAMDTTMPGMSMEKIREIGMRMQRGGVGYYQTSNFVHLDVGTVRSWPRMNYDQLVRLFPDGKTVHIPSNGQPLARYEEARAEIEANGGGGYAPPSQSKGFFAWLFGGNKNEDEEEEGVAAAPAPNRGRTRVASIDRSAPLGRASSYSASTEDGGRNLVAEDATRAAAPSAERTPRGVTQPQQQPSVTALPVPKPASDTRSRTLVATAAPAQDEADASNDSPAFGALLPIPPRRPLELVAVADVPLPPVRPVALVASLQPVAVPKTSEPAGSISLASASGLGLKTDAKNDPIGNLIYATGTGTSSARATNFSTASLSTAGLPVVITQGSSDRRASATRPSEVLAYAPAAQIRGLRTAALAKSAPQPPVAEHPSEAVVPARLDRSNFRSLTAGVATTQTTTQSVLGPAVAGLRQAARVANGTFSNQLSAGYASHFASAATDLDTSHFTGPAVQPLAGTLLASSALRRD